MKSQCSGRSVNDERSEVREGGSLGWGAGPAPPGLGRALVQALLWVLVSEPGCRFRVDHHYVHVGV